MKVRFLTPARDELRDGIQYYELQRNGLGRDFRDEVRAAIALIREYPLAWQSFSANTRRCILRRFPYAVVYQIRESEILVVAIANLHRSPEYWADRL